MEQIDLNAEIRTTTGKQVARIRSNGFVPAVIYGSHYAATPIQVESKVLHKTLARAAGNMLINLRIPGHEPVPVLARQVQRATLKHHIIHVDFQHVVMTEKITADVPLKLVGESPAVRLLAGVLVHGIDRLSVHCLPADLPGTIEVDLSRLAKFQDSVTVADLHLPANVTIMAEPETVIARIEAPRVAEAEEEAVAAPAEAEPELVARHIEREEEKPERK